ncbi:putative integral membrane protein [Diaporthe ampelina]|uniref:Putative integral membrane protein n=1 Tax=Diaporthe ampelina TaxID=1214573 RepID=A0A0G2FDX7_9PEZI|nr:putative integral membrane protein [Diaporthe ampelina]
MDGTLSSSPEYLAEDIGYKLLSTTYAFIVLITVVYGLFVVSRFFFAERNGWEIWTIYPITYVFCLTLCITCILLQKLADGGRHVLYVLGTEPKKLETWLKIQTADEAIYMTSVTLPKVAILIMFLHIFVEKRVRLITKVVMVVVVLHWLASGIIVMFTICQPFSFKWDKSIDGHCSNLIAAYRYISIPNILTDLAILVLPSSTLWHLNMSRTRKAGVFLTFLAGGLGIVTSIMRFIAFYDTNIDSDLTYLGVYTMIYTEAEACAYFICSCLPGCFNI